MYVTNASKISLVCSLLTGKALEWVTAVWREDGTAFPSFGTFLQRFREIFEHPEGGMRADDRLLELSQGRNTAAEYALTFRTLAAQTDWVESTLKLLFRKGLSLELQSELACRDEGRSLNQFIELTIQIDNLIRSRRPLRTVPTSTQYPVTLSQTEPMQLGYTHLTPEERERRIRQHLCLYCGQPGHLRAFCPTRPPPRNPSSVSPCVQAHHSSSCIKVPIVLSLEGNHISTSALLDSGAAGNFMSHEFAQQQQLPLISCNSQLAVEALDGRPLGDGRVLHTTVDLQLQTGTLHTEVIRFYVITSPHNPVILGLPWLRQHNPLISWREGRIIKWD
uniref:CCHC-type domain-containing protein n=1 Tax=Hucho hucho TaxID=62062 RepID=A0A4W5LSR2_9TELE